MSSRAEKTIMVQLLVYCLCLLRTATFVIGQQNNDFEIKTVTGEPDYRSVNLTWSIEELKSKIRLNTNQNSRAFNVFYCELQTWGPHRCKSKILEDNEIDSDEFQKQYSMIIDNLRMATKYSFHVKPQNKGQKISGRADLGENDLGPNGKFQGQTIVIPTKGFSAHATKCLPDASEIEVETGPYFGGRIVVEGGNHDCEIQGDFESDQEKYVMRIDHEHCGSNVDRETLTVKTFITVQENLGIFTHSTRRFLVVCTYQPDTLTIRASFSVPGKAAVALVSPEWENDRGARDRKFRMVDKSSLVLKEDYPDDLHNESIIKDTKSLESLKVSIDEQKMIKENIIDPNEVDHLKNPKYARLIHNTQTNEGFNNKDFGYDYTGLLMAVSLAIILMGVVIFILHRESHKRRLVQS